MRMGERIKTSSFPHLLVSSYYKKIDCKWNPNFISAGNSWFIKQTS